MKNMKLTEIFKIIRRNDPDELFNLGWINSWNEDKKEPYGGDSTLDYLDSIAWACRLKRKPRILMNKIFLMMRLTYILDWKMQWGTLDRTDIWGSLNDGHKGYYRDWNPSRANCYSAKFNKELFLAMIEEVNYLLTIPEVHFDNRLDMMEKYIIDNNVSISDAYNDLNIPKLVRLGITECTDLSSSDLRYLMSLDDSYNRIIRSNLKDIVKMKTRNPDIELKDIVDILIEVEDTV